MGRLLQTKAETSDGSGNLVNQVADTIYHGLSQATKVSQPRYVTETSGTFEVRTPLASRVGRRDASSALFTRRSTPPAARSKLSRPRPVQSPNKIDRSEYLC